MAKERLNGYWTRKYGGHYVFVDRVYKKGYVTGRKYYKTDEGEVMGDFRATHEELKRDYLKHP